MEYEIITFESITEAHKAKRILRKSGIESSIVKVDPKQSAKGCSYGLRYRREDGFSVANELHGLGLRFSAYREKQ